MMEAHDQCTQNFEVKSAPKSLNNLHNRMIGSMPFMESHPGPGNKEMASAKAITDRRSSPLIRGSH